MSPLPPEPVIDPVDWDDLRACLVPDAFVHRREEVALLRLGTDRLVLLELPGRWRARHRRGAHRRGFRPVAVDGAVAWQWRVPESRVDAELQREAAPGAALPAVGTFLWSVTATPVVERIIRACGVSVLRDVLGVVPAELSCVLPEDPEQDPWDVDGLGWSDDPDEPWSCSA